MVVDDDRARALLLDLLNRVRVQTELGDLLGSDIDQVEAVFQLSPVVRSMPGIAWVGVNGARVDAILSDENDEWRVVFGTEDGRRVDWLSIHRRPPFFSGVKGGRAIVVNGPSGAGKSTLLEAVRRTDATRPWVIFDEPERVGSVRSEYLIWRDQTPSLQRGFLAAIGALAAAGNLVAVSAGGRSQAAFTSCLPQTPTLCVGLYCDRNVLMARERSRSDRWGGLAESSLSVHDGWRYDLTFDTSASPDPAEMALESLQVLGVLS